MMQSIKSVFWGSPKPEKKILLLGLDKSGKSVDSTSK